MRNPSQGGAVDSPVAFRWYNPQLPKGDTMKVDIYFNLHKRVYSIRSREPHNYGKVIGHAHTIGIYPPKGVVSEKGRQRVLVEQRKNVHAVIRGELDMECLTEGWPDRYQWDDGERLEQWVYNPYFYQEFVTASTANAVNDYKWTYVHMTTNQGRPVVRGAKQ